MCLTALDLPGPAAGDEVYLPTSLQQLKLCYTPVGPVTHDLRHLINLRAVDVRVPSGVVTLVLGPQLDSLDVIGGLRVQGLERVASVALLAGAEADLQLLQDVCWQHGPSSLVLDAVLAGVSGAARSSLVAALQEAAAAVGVCSNSESFKLRSVSGHVDGVPWCTEVAKLSSLRTLRMVCRRLPAQQLLHLAACSSLQSLQLCCEGVDDFTAVGLLSKLPRLQHLLLSCRDLRSMAVLGCVSVLTDLTALHLVHWQLGQHEVKMHDHHLQGLLSLQKLRELALPPLQHCSEAAVAGLRTRMPDLKKLLRM